MIEATVYNLEDGKKLVLLGSIKFENIKYLLLSDEYSNETMIAFENENELNFIDELYPNYEKISLMLLEKFERNLKGKTINKRRDV